MFLHFDRGRHLARQYDCYVVKSIGDSFMVAFRTSTDAVLFATDFSIGTGVEYISIRAGINSGQVQIRENDIYGLNVNFTSRIQHVIDHVGIFMSNSVYIDYVKAFGEDTPGVRFIKREVDLKSFGPQSLWEIRTREWVKAVGEQNRARKVILSELSKEALVGIPKLRNS
ncbi:MAG: adenylate/guanylate cyclase domain-containing protein [Pyrinomonadaceae bacterium]